MGKGAWSQQRLSGLTWKSMRQHYCIIPTIALAVFGVVGAAGHLIRVATKHPEISLTRGNPEPWQEYSNKQYKYISSGRDYSVPSAAPNYK